MEKWLKQSFYPYFYVNSTSFGEFDAFDVENYADVMGDDKVEAIRENISDYWGIHDRKSLMKTTDSLLQKGDKYTYAQTLEKLGEEALTLPEDSIYYTYKLYAPDEMCKYLGTYYAYNNIGDAGVDAWDYCRCIRLFAFGLILLIVLRIGQGNVKLDHIFSRSAAGIGHGNRRRHCFGRQIHFQAVQGLAEGRIGEAVAKGIGDFRIILPGCAVYTSHRIGGISLSQNAVRIPRFIIFISRIDAFRFHQRGINGISRIRIGVFEISVILCGRGIAVLYRVRIGQMAGWIGRSA